MLTGLCQSFEPKPKLVQNWLEARPDSNGTSINLKPNWFGMVWYILKIAEASIEFLFQVFNPIKIWYSNINSFFQTIL